MNDSSMATIFGALIGGAFGTVIALSGAWVNYRISQQRRADEQEVSQQRTAAEEQRRADELFATALGFLGGGSQQRNLGIAAISLYWRQFPRHTQLCAEILVGSAIYLLSQSKQKDASHELFNLQRMMDLLKEISNHVPDKSSYVRLAAFVKNRIETYEAKPERGLWTETVDLQRWQKLLNDSAKEKSRD